jgi:NAD(P)-dependent dehydrogenase (short-subunit alcohol dehydrogenase family)
VNIDGKLAVVSGGASGLGLATVANLVRRGAKVAVLDRADPNEVVTKFSPGAVTFIETDVSDKDQLTRAFELIAGLGDFRVLVHTAGIGGKVRLVERDGLPGDSAIFERVLRVNLLGTFLVLSCAAAAMAGNEPIDGERGVAVLTSSIAAYDGQIGQAAYSSAKGGVVSLTLPAARDLASKLIRVCTIAPGTFNTPLLDGLRQDVRSALEAQTPHPARLGHVDEYAALATHIIENPMLNGETIRLDGALRMPPR